MIISIVYAQMRTCIQTMNEAHYLQLRSCTVRGGGMQSHACYTVLHSCPFACLFAHAEPTQRGMKPK